MKKDKRFVLFSFATSIGLLSLAMIVLINSVGVRTNGTSEIISNIRAILGNNVANSDLNDKAPFFEDDSLHTVTEIVDGDTIKLEGIGTIRLIGIDTPELKDPRVEVQCYAKEASEKAKELLEGRRVRLEFDDTQGRVDKYGRTLAYIHIEDGLFYNKVMIEEGYAYEYTYSTPYRYQREFQAAQKIARESKRGLWGDACKCAREVEISRVCIACGLARIVVENFDCSEEVRFMHDELCDLMCVDPNDRTKGSVENEISWSSDLVCDCNKACSVLNSCEEAYFQLLECGCTARDGNNDGVPCRALCL